MNIKQKYKNIIFDLGAVLVYWNPKEIIQNMFENKQTMPFEQWKELLTSEFFNNLDAGRISEQQAIDQLNSKYNKEQFEHFLKNVHKYIKPLEQGLKILDLVKDAGYKTFVLSNFGKDRFERAKKLHNYDFLNLFDGIVISYETKFLKPEAGVYKFLLEKYNLNPDKSLFIDDSEENISAGEKLGIDGVVCSNHECLLVELINKKVLL